MKSYHLNIATGDDDSLVAAYSAKGDLTGGKVNRQEFTSAYLPLLEKGLSILEKEDRLPPNEIDILKVFMAEGYEAFAKKYEKTKYQIISCWIKKQINKAKAVSPGRFPDWRCEEAQNEEKEKK